ncbi:MAG: hydroxyacid dehydrogenase, partial [Allorhizobium sp.]
MSRTVILVDPLPRTLDLIMEPAVRARLEALGEVIVSEDRPMSAEEV